MPTRPELIALLKTNGIKGYSGKNKAELEAMVRAIGSKPVLTPVVTVATGVSIKPKEDAIVEMTLKTEDTGKIFEMAICLAFNTPYDGKYKYGMEIAEKLKIRLSKLTDMFPPCRHTAKKGARYDFTCLTDESKHLSAKSTKKGVGKVAPQVIGQSQPQKFCEIIGTEFITIPDLKRHIQTEIKKILHILVGYTLDCPNVYYNHEKNTIRYITLTTPIEWNKYHFSWTCGWVDWGNSSTLKILTAEGEVPLLEFQFHTKSRTNMAIRWCYENFLSVFKENLSITDI